MTDTATDTRVIDVKGRAIVVRQLKDAQILLMSRDAMTLGKEDVTGAEKLQAAGWILDTIESAIVQVKDREYVLDTIRRGGLEVKDLLGFVSVFVNTEDTPKKPVVRRGRPPRAR
jgi:hypothetical protein